MNPEIKTKWIYRLRSGTIPQTSDVLGSVNGERCCLGVLCDIAVEAGIIEIRNEDHNHQYGDYIYGIDGDESQTSLPEKVQQWAGIDSGEGDVSVRVENLSGTYYKQTSLAVLNDCGSTFEEIADIIEEYF